MCIYSVAFSFLIAYGFIMGVCCCFLHFYNLIWRCIEVKTHSLGSFFQFSGAAGRRTVEYVVFR